jgi:hypothetical protein
VNLQKLQTESRKYNLQRRDLQSLYSKARCPIFASSGPLWWLGGVWEGRAGGRAGGRVWKGELRHSFLGGVKAHTS